MCCRDSVEGLARGYGSRVKTTIQRLDKAGRPDLAKRLLDTPKAKEGEAPKRDKKNVPHHRRRNKKKKRR